MHLNTLYTAVKNLLEEVKVEFFSSIRHEKLEIKSLNQLVTEVDKAVEVRLVEGLQELLPESTFMTEEDSIENQTGIYTWIIDPIDGTTNFVHGVPLFSISVALTHLGKPILGFVYELGRNELFSAVDGKAYLNDQPIQVSKNLDLASSLMATGFPYYDFDGMEAYLKVLQNLMKNTRGLRRMGSAAVDLAYTACGRFDGFFEYGLNPWDVAAGVYLVECAGGKTSDFNGMDKAISGKTIVASQPSIYNDLMEIIQHEFGYKK
jgi:myo-inositol-1(or 4)-monophosphatase